MPGNYHRIFSNIINFYFEILLIKRVIFNPIVYHPLISTESGELDVKQYIKNWKLNIHHIYHVLFYVRRIFYQIDTKDCLNKEAANLY